MNQPLKIRWVDTQEVVEVTKPEQLANTKVRVTPETSRQIQEATFPLGYAWPGVTRSVKNEDESFLYFDSLSTHTGSVFMLTYGIEDSTFKNSKKREFQFIFPTSETTDPETRELVRDIEIVKAGEEWIREQDRTKLITLLEQFRKEKRERKGSNQWRKGYFQALEDFKQSLSQS